MKTTLPKGTRDFTSIEVAKRNYIFDTIKKVFKKFGFAPIETPAMESLSTLTGKYGEEGDQLLFKVLNNGDFLKSVNEKDLVNKNSSGLVKQISKRGLRYDLTVPLARFVTMNQSKINFPFKRYQIQPVWRADRPQKGRYQEFYQCDADIIGSNSLMNEAELVQIYDEVFKRLHLEVDIKVNNRKILNGIAEVANIKNQFVDMTVAIDKLDKKGEKGVREEFENRGIGALAADVVFKFLKIDSLDELEKEIQTSEVGLIGVEELKLFHKYLDLQPTNNNVKLDITLARGLSYYTGCIFEVVSKSAKMGSIGGGGRYADLTTSFGLKDMSGVGISFGAERIFDIMEELSLFPDSVSKSIDLLFLAFDSSAHLYAFNCLNQVRAKGIAAELYPEPNKFKKQMKYANNRSIPFVVIIGDSEMESDLLTFKDMNSGIQEKLNIEAIIDRFYKPK